MTEQYVQVTVDEGIATVTIDRQSAMNALNPDVLAQLGEAFARVDADMSVRAAMLTGAGKAFVAGADIAAMKTMSVADAERVSRFGSDVFVSIEMCRVPVMAVVNGFALGGGCELALACDFIYASTKAKFGQPEVQLGLVTGFGGTQRLPRKVGYGMAMELLLAGQMISAAEAHRIGLVNRVVEPDELMSVARATLQKIAGQGPVAVRVTRELVQRALDTPLQEGLHAESTAFGAIFGTEDSQEGIGAFLEKRAATFHGK
jgi:enoyl-CoA hydratase